MSSSPRLLPSLSIGVVLLATLVPTARAQGPDTGRAREAMKALDWMTGVWEGEASMRTGPGEARQARGKEILQSKLGGLALLIEGEFYGTYDGALKEPVHQALAVLSYDTARQGYRLKSYTREGRSGEFDARLVGPKSLEWTIPAQGATIRYTISLDDQGNWVERGERST